MNRLPTKIRSSLKAGASQRSQSVHVSRGEQREGDRPPQVVPQLEHVPARLLRFPAVRDRTGLSRSTIWRLERQGAFPKHRRISAHAVAWLEHEVTAWIREKSADAAG